VQNVVTSFDEEKVFENELVRKISGQLRTGLLHIDELYDVHSPLISLLKQGYGRHRMKLQWEPINKQMLFKTDLTERRGSGCNQPKTVSDDGLSYWWSWTFGFYKCYVFGHYPSPCLYLKHSPVYFSKQNVPETGFCLRLQVKPTQLGPIDRGSPYLRLYLKTETESSLRNIVLKTKRTVFLIKTRRWIMSKS
jgi:hypothetical protein